MTPDFDLVRKALDAAADGSKAIFLIESGPLAGNLYEFDAAKHKATLIAAKALGYEYVAMTDHSATHGFGNDVSIAEANG